MEGSGGLVGRLTFEGRETQLRHTGRQRWEGFWEIVCCRVAVFGRMLCIR